MFKSIVMSIMFSSFLVGVTFSESEMLAEYAKFEKKIAPDNEVREYARKHLRSVKDIPSFIRQAKAKGIKDVSKYYYHILSLYDFGEGVTVSNFLSSIEYKYVLRYLKPEVHASGDNNHISIRAEYMNSKSFSYSFPVSCRYSHTSTKIENLGFFEVFGTAGMAESKNVTYKIYECKLKPTELRKIKTWEKVLKTRKISKVLSKSPWKKSVVIRKTYNKATYRAPVANTYGSTSTSTGGSTSTTSSSQNRNTNSNSVKEVYDGGYESSDGHTIYRVVCTNGNSYSAYQKPDGYWYDTGSSYGNRYRHLSRDQFAAKKCQ